MNQIRRNVGKSENHVAEIFLAVDRPDQADEVLRNAQRILEQIRVGTPFSVMAQQFSQSASAAQGGDLGWVLPGQFEPAVEAAIAKLQPGRVTEQPIRSAAGWHILALINRRTFGAAGSGNPAEVRVNVVQLLLPLPPNASQDEIARGTAEAQKIMGLVTKCDDLRAAAARTRGATASRRQAARRQSAGQCRATDRLGADRPRARSFAIRLDPDLSICSKRATGDAQPRRDQQQILSSKLEAAARRMRDLRRLRSSRSADRPCP